MGYEINSAGATSTTNSIDDDSRLLLPHEKKVTSLNEVEWKGMEQVEMKREEMEVNGMELNTNGFSTKQRHSQRQRQRQPQRQQHRRRRRQHFHHLQQQERPPPLYPSVMRDVFPVLSFC